MKREPEINIKNVDCMEFMTQIPDNYYELAIVDPPYGIGQNWKKDRHSKFYTHDSSYKNNSIPGKDYFDQLFRVSVNQIIWGGNYYTNFLQPTNSWIVWDKNRNYKNSHMSEGELAWCSIRRPLLIAPFVWNGCIRCEKRYGVHPHEKPTKLYRWILENYAKPGDKILDTHGGSMSIALACYDKGFDLDICEIDKYYFEEGEKRLEKHIDRWHAGMDRPIKDETDYSQIGIFKNQ